MFASSIRIVLLAAVCAVPLVHAGPAAAAHPQVRQGTEKPKTELAKLMGQINKHMKALKSDIAKPARKSANAAAFDAIADLAAKCKAHPPESAKTDDDKKKFAGMLDEVAAAGQAGAKAAAAGDIPGAKKAYDALKKLKMSGHEKFIPEEK